MTLADKLLIVSVLSLVVLFAPSHVFAKSSHSSGSHGQSSQSHGNSAFGHSHQTSSVGSDVVSSGSTGGGGIDIIYPCVHSYQYNNFYQQLSPYKTSYNSYMHSQSLKILYFYEQYKNTGKYCSIPMLEFGDMS